MKTQKAKRTPLFGAHMSIAGGVEKSLERGSELGCTAIQIFLKYNTRWKGKPLTPQEQKAFLTKKKKTGIQKIIAHNCYLINLASPETGTYQKSLSAMKDELGRAAALEIPFLVIHPGSHKGSGMVRGIKKIAHSLNLLLETSLPHKVSILLETTAGQGTGIGHRFEQIAEILSLVKKKPRMGVCLDTAHIFAAGYDIRTKKAYRETLKEFDRTISLKRLKAIHMNDSKKPLGSRIDRHEHIGEGYIGLETFRFIMNDERFSSLPKILETPKRQGDKYDIKNLQILKSLASP